jgi:cytochrome c553
MTAKFVAAVVLVTTVAWTGPVLAAGSKEAGQAKAATCVACHGSDGNSVNPEWPSIAGQHETYIVRQLTNFRDGERQNLLMSPMAMGLSDQDVEDLAAFFASQSASGGETEPSKLALGQRVYRSGNLEAEVAACAGCHGPDGRGNPLAAYPSIQGQHATYLAAQLRAYRNGERSTDPNQMMRNIAAGLSDEEIDAVASYVQGLR